MDKKNDMLIYPGGLTWSDRAPYQDQPITSRSRFHILAKRLRFQMGQYHEILFGPVETLAAMLVVIARVFLEDWRMSVESAPATRLEAWCAKRSLPLRFCSEILRDARLAVLTVRFLPKSLETSNVQVQQAPAVGRSAGTEG